MVESLNPSLHESPSSHDGHSGQTAFLSRSRERFSPSQLKLIRAYLRLRDCNDGSGKCRVCGVSETERELIIDHVDGNPRNNELPNLRFLCRSCNLKEKYRHDRERVAAMTGTRQGVRVRGISGDGEEGLRLQRLGFAADMEQGGGLDILRLNRKNEPWFRSLLLEKCLEEGQVPYEYAINALAEIVGCSQDACMDYYKKITSPPGPLLEEELGNGVRVVKIKPEYWERLEQQEKQLRKVPPKDVRPLDEYVGDQKR